MFISAIQSNKISQNYLNLFNQNKRGRDKQLSFGSGFLGNPVADGILGIFFLAAVTNCLARMQLLGKWAYKFVSGDKTMIE